jgi:hypothetical protein
MWLWVFSSAPLTISGLGLRRQAPGWLLLGNRRLRRATVRHIPQGQWPLCGDDPMSRVSARNQEMHVMRDRSMCSLAAQS